MTAITHDEFTRRLLQAIISGLIDMNHTLTQEDLNHARICCEALAVAAECGQLDDMAKVCEQWVTVKIRETEIEVGRLKAGVGK